MEKRDFHHRIGRPVYIAGLNCELRPNQKRRVVQQGKRGGGGKRKRGTAKRSWLRPEIGETLRKVNWRR